MCTTQELGQMVQEKNFPSMKALKEEMKLKGKYLQNFNQKCKNTRIIHNNIFWLLGKPHTYLNAYGNISRNKGSTTPGLNKETLSGFSYEKCVNLAKQIQEQTFNPTPVKRMYVPKPGKKEKRPLGIPNIQDRIVQEAIRGILEAIYEPIFKELDENSNFKVNNFGFRPALGCWDAIERLTSRGQGINMVIEGDIKGAYDNVDHDILLSILRKKITDKKFLALIKKFLKAGVMERGEYRHSLLGVPQGGIVSPILFNIYMMELDHFIMETFKEWETENEKHPSTPNKDPYFQRVAYQTRKLVKTMQVQKDPKEKKKILKQLKEQQKIQFQIPSYNPKTLRKKFIYIRYADDWILGFSGSLSEAEELKEKIKYFLLEKLKLQLSEEKTKITNIKKNSIDYLGYTILIQSDYRTTKKMVIRKKPSSLKGTWSTTTQRTTSGKYLVLPNKNKLLTNITRRGFCQGPHYYPIGIRAWSQLTEFQIVQKYHNLFMGLIQHYKKCNNFYILNRINYILHYSCAKTLATRLKITMPQVFNKYGKDLKVTTTIVKNKEGDITQRTIQFLTLTAWKKKYGNNIGKPGLKTEYDPFKIITFWRTKFKLISFCCICGATENIEMHHTNSIKKIGKKVQGFNKILQQLNRKQIPVCKSCHNLITAGKYDSIDPSTLYSETLARL